MVKIVYNRSYSGFALSDVALKLYNQKRLQNGLLEQERKIERHDIHLIEVVEELGLQAGHRAYLDTVEIPDVYTQYYEIDETDGKETVKILYRDYLHDKFKSLNLASLSDANCREQLESLRDLFINN